MTHHQPEPLARDKYLDAGEAARLLTTTAAWHADATAADARQGVVAWMIVDLAMNTGLRVGELAALDVGDYRRKNRVLHVRTLKQRKERRDVVALSPAMARHVAAFITWKREHGEGVAGDDPLLVSKTGDRFRVRGLQLVWKSAIRRAQLPDYSIKAARHTFAVALYAKTRDPILVRDALRHTCLATTEIYAQVPFEDRRDGVTGLYAA